MTRVVAGLVAALLLTAMVVLAMSWSDTMTRDCYSDGSFPRWMLDAQDYDGSGFACVLPSHEAPPNADWTLQSTGGEKLESAPRSERWATGRGSGAQDALLELTVKLRELTA